MELQGRLDALRQQGLGLAVISYDSRAILAAFANQRSITFPLLSDQGSATISRFGLLNTIPEEALKAAGSDSEVAAAARKYVSPAGANANQVGMAFPGTFILDRQGRVQSRFFEELYTERNTVTSIMARLGQGGTEVATTSVATPHLELTTFASDTTIAPGTRLMLTLSITPKANMHVYAPGADALGYRVIGLALDEQPFVRALPLAFPASEIYHFVPLNERVPVFLKPFMLRQEVVVAGNQQARAAFAKQTELVLTGQLTYQACDDRVCYNPQTIPLAWRMAIKPLITERPQVVP